MLPRRDGGGGGVADDRVLVLLHDVGRRPSRPAIGGRPDPRVRRWEGTAMAAVQRRRVDEAAAAADVVRSPPGRGNGRNVRPHGGVEEAREVGPASRLSDEEESVKLPVGTLRVARVLPSVRQGHPAEQGRRPGEIGPHPRIFGRRPGVAHCRRRDVRQPRARPGGKARVLRRGAVAAAPPQAGQLPVAKHVEAAAGWRVREAPGRRPALIRLLEARLRLGLSKSKARRGHGEGREWSDEADGRTDGQCDQQQQQRHVLSRQTPDRQWCNSVTEVGNIDHSGQPGGGGGVQPISTGLSVSGAILSPLCSEQFRIFTVL